MYDKKQSMMPEDMCGCLKMDAPSLRRAALRYDTAHSASIPRISTRFVGTHGAPPMAPLGISVRAEAHAFSHSFFFYC
jgi:hypothetical protein